jgi:general secretion pathway protein G
MNGKIGKNRQPEEGFSLVELLVALGILSLIAALVAPQIIRYLGQARSQTAATQLKNLESAIELYYLDTGAYPPAAQGVDALIEAPAGAVGWNGPYLKKRNGLTDPWKRPFVYKTPGDHGAFDLSTLGRDGKAGGTGEDADVVNW